MGNFPISSHKSTPLIARTYEGKMILQSAFQDEESGQWYDLEIYVEDSKKKAIPFKDGQSFSRSTLLQIREIAASIFKDIYPNNSESAEIVYVAPGRANRQERCFSVQEGAEEADFLASQDHKTVVDRTRHIYELLISRQVGLSLDPNRSHLVKLRGLEYSEVTARYPSKPKPIETDSSQPASSPPPAATQVEEKAAEAVRKAHEAFSPTFDFLKNLELSTFQKYSQGEVAASPSLEEAYRVYQELVANPERQDEKHKEMMRWLKHLYEAALAEYEKHPSFKEQFYSKNPQASKSDFEQECKTRAANYIILYIVVEANTEKLIKHLKDNKVI